MRFLSIGTVLSLMIVATLGCHSDESPFVPTPETSDDAQLIAIILGETLRPNQDLALSVAKELADIREKFGEEIPAVHLSPFPMWVQNEVTLWMTEGAAESVRAGTYTAWNELNEDEGGSLKSVNPNRPRVTLKFEPWIHSRLMAEKYYGLPGVVSAGTDGYAGDWSNLYPFQHGFGRSYLLRKGGGDCPAGCTENEYWYFRQSTQGMEYVGCWKRGGERPDWWAEAQQNKDYFFRW